jgi:hypothetical protein
LKEKNKMKHGAMLTAVVFGFLMSSGVEAAKSPGQICPNGDNPCPPPNSGQCCPSTVVHLEAEKGTGYVLPKGFIFRCETGLTRKKGPGDFFVCKSTDPTEPEESEPEENSKK